MNASPVLVCPADHQSLRVTGGRAECALCGSVYMRVGQIWRFVRANERTAAFLDAYRAVRRGEGWGAIDPHYYHHLPHVDAADPQRETWRVRAASFSALLRVIGQRRHVLDLGAGNGWLAYQLLRRGHSVAPVDLSADEYDGLGALGNYPIPFDAYQAD